MLHIAQLIRSAFKTSFFHHVDPTSNRSAKSTKTPKTASPHSQLHGEALAVANELRGKCLHLSDLTKVLGSWPTATNKYVNELEVLVDSLLERIVTNKRKLEALKQANFARLMSLWYPDAEWPELKVATAYSVWIFVWDDEIDAGDTDAAVNEDLAQAYYRQSLTYIHGMLGLDGGDPYKLEAPHQNMALFADVGHGVRDVTDVQQRQRFFDELENFMLQVGIEHTYRMAGTIPTTDEYMTIRSGSVGCAPQIAITDFMLKMRLPETVMDSAAMRALWKETIYICLILNDVYSVQKEIVQGSLLNLVPVMFKHMRREDQRNMDAVSSNLDIALKETIDRFEAAAEELSAIAPEDGQLHGNILDFIKWCRYFITGVLYWSLESRRYGMAKCVNADGTLSITL
ncbi:isoprenoid synthase domain-containing protein [Astrocystis sublimbata]|nr:isoprenoid synthase domain-containing protein [Astrocystis sublimbata]